MIGNQVMYVFIPLFLTLVITVSTAPILDILDNRLVTKIFEKKFINETITTTEPVVYEDDKSESNETSSEQDIESTIINYKDETTIIPEVVTTGLLFVDTTQVFIDIDDIIKTSDRLLFANDDELPSTPTTESPESAQLNTADDT